MITTITLNPAIDKTIYVNNFDINILNFIDKTIVEAGGKGLNVAKVLKLHNIKHMALTFIHKDETEFKNLIEKQELTYKYISINSKMRTNIKLIDKNSNSSTDINELGPVINDNELTAFMKLYENYLTNSKYVVLSGSIPKGIANNIYYDLITLANKHSIKIFLDTSNEPLKLALKAKIFLIKPNLHELQLLANKQFENKQAIINYAKSLISDKLKYICLSLGSAGALLISQDEVYHGKVNGITSVNNIGAGDSLIAGIVCEYRKSEDILKAFEYGLAIAGMAIQELGTSLTTLKDIDKYLKKVTIERI